MVSRAFGSGLFFKLKPKVQKVNFGEEQLEALSKLEDFTRSKEDTITLSGSAGTGKTSLIIEYLDFLDDEKVPYILAAPTHKAKLVLEALTGEDAYTVHQVLSLQPNLDIMELDFRELDFFAKSNSNKPNQIPYRGVIIVDEASMISDDLFKFILKCAKQSLTKVIWVGDCKQLQPVKSDTLSKVFTLDNVIILTKIYRQKDDSPVLDVLSELREHSLKVIEPCKGKVDSIFTFNNALEFAKSAKEPMQETVKTGNVLNCKVLAFTNSRVSAYNNTLRKLIFGKDYVKEFNQGEILTGYDNLEFETSKFYNSLDYVVKDIPVKEYRRIPYYDLPLNGYDLQLFDTVYKTTNKVFVLSRDNDTESLNNLTKLIEQTRLQALRLQNAGKSAKLIWSKYYMIINSFATTFDLYYENRVIKRKTFDYGYALTVHKSQGSSFNTVFVDLANINTCPDPEVVRQLQYVGISRTKGDVYLLV
jgi:exodeoxyribonuclease-5